MKFFNCILLSVFIGLTTACTQQDWLTAAAIFAESSKRKPLEIDNDFSLTNYSTETRKPVSYTRRGNVIYGSDGSVCKVVEDNVFCY